MKTEVTFYNLRGNLAAIRDYAKVIASMSPANCNAYVMAFDKNDEILWVIQAGDDIDEVKAAINWKGVSRVEIYDHSLDGKYKYESVFVTSRKSINAYTSERTADEFTVTANYTAYKVCAWQTVADDNDTNDAQGDETNEGDQTPSEPSRLAQVAKKAAEKAKTFARRAVFAVSLAAVAVLCLAFAVGCLSALAPVFDAVGIGGFARLGLVVCALLPILDVTLWIEANALALVARLFPGMFQGNGPQFCAPGFFWHVYRSNMA